VARGLGFIRCSGGGFRRDTWAGLGRPPGAALNAGCREVLRAGLVAIETLAFGS
jgi:hypothetical protein